MQIDVHAELDFAAPPEQVFDVAADYRNFARIFRPLAPIPGVESAEMLDGAQPASGTRRRLGMSDRTTVEEDVLVFDRPREHRYRWTKPPAPPFSLIVRAGEGCWQFEPHGSGTRLSWTYRFELTSPLVYPLGRLITLLFRRWMVQALANVQASLAG